MMSKEDSIIYEKIAFPVAMDVGFCFYERNLETVKRAIESVKDHVRYIFAIDGKFEFFESDELYSSKEIRDYLETIPNVIRIDYPNRKENEKRQQYLELCEEYMTDFLLILDADEYMTDECNWTEAYAHMRQLYDHEISPKIFGVTMRHGKKEGSHPRIWRRPFLIQYLKTHNFWRFKTTGEIWKSTIANIPIKGLFMKGDDKERDPEYVKSAYAYQLKLMSYELPYKQEYRKVARNVSEKYSDNRLPGIPLS